MSKVPDWFDPESWDHFYLRFPDSTVEGWEWACRQEWMDIDGGDKFGKPFSARVAGLRAARARIAHMAEEGIGMKAGLHHYRKLAHLVQTRRQGALWAYLVGRKKRSWRQVRALLVKRRLDG